MVVSLTPGEASAAAPGISAGRSGRTNAVSWASNDQFVVGINQSSDQKGSRPIESIAENDREPNASAPTPSAGSARAEAAGFDAFIVYNSRDVRHVRRVVDALRSRGIRSWIDTENLCPGRLYQDEFDMILRGCRSAVVFVGPDGLGPWEELEVKVALSQFVRRRLPVIPVLLFMNASPVLPVFLSEFRAVRVADTDFSASIDDLVWGITGHRQSPA